MCKVQNTAPWYSQWRWWKQQRTMLFIIWVTSIWFCLVSFRLRSLCSCILASGKPVLCMSSCSDCCDHVTSLQVRNATVVRLSCLYNTSVEWNSSLQFLLNNAYMYKARVQIDAKILQSNKSVYGGEGSSDAWLVGGSQLHRQFQPHTVGFCRLIQVWMPSQLKVIWPLLLL